jgi:UDP-GlcNAc3NAcA epimerase
MLKILTVVGARPQFIKAATISRLIADDPEVEEIIVHTGQHFDENMSEVFFRDMEIPSPKYNLNINALSHGAMTGRMMEGIESLIFSEKPDVVLVYGDTNSTIAGALAAKKIHVPVGHVEAGLRSFNLAMPEEVNRILTDRISDFLSCPTDAAVTNLKKEGFDQFSAQVFQTGDVMYDAALFYADRSEEKAVVAHRFTGKEFALCTLHRAENTDNCELLREWVSGINRIHQDLMVVCPLHPRTKKKLQEFGLELKAELIDPVGYFDMIEFLKHTKLVLTDSGGLQKEAFFFKRPCITMRDQTEWVELVEHGYNQLVAPQASSLYHAFIDTMQREIGFEHNLYGQGRAANEILSHLKASLRVG